jgi:hypothetical protein
MMVEQEERKYDLLRALSDEYKRRILSSTTSCAKSMEEISRENEIPVSTCYRRVHELINLRLLRVESTIITPNGKKYETFRSVLKGVSVTLESGQLFVDVVMNPRAPEERLHSLWKSVNEGNENYPAPKLAENPLLLIAE